MANDLSTIGSIAIYLVDIFPGLSAGVSGNMVLTVDLARQDVENFTGLNIGSNAILDKFQPPIVNFAKADTVDLFNAQAGGEKIKLSDLSIEETGEAMSAEQYRKLGEIEACLKLLISRGVKKFG